MKKEVVQSGRGAAINKLLRLAQKEKAKGNLERARKFLENAQFLKSTTPTIWG